MTEIQTGKVRVIASDKNWIEGAALQQLEKTASLAGMRLAVGLPDLHPGKGSPIGAAFLTESWIYPALVGNDIGCGIGLWRTGLGAKGIKREVWSDRLRDMEDAWEGDVDRFLEQWGIEKSGYEGSLGTIGGGNHFAELQAVENIVNREECEKLGITQDAVCLCVHSGSRGFGESILREHITRFGSAGLPAESADAREYLGKHDHAKSWASANRELIALRTLDRLRTGGVRLVDICHNSVERPDKGWLHRKGAAPSTEGAVVIPGSRGAFTYVVAPKEPSERSAFSLAHGSARKNAVRTYWT
jgi:release factor H-coupled RctB family protein